MQIQLCQLFQLCIKAEKDLFPFLQCLNEDALTDRMGISGFYLLLFITCEIHTNCDHYLKLETGLGFIWQVVVECFDHIPNATASRKSPCWLA